MRGEPVLLCLKKIKSAHNRPFDRVIGMSPYEAFTTIKGKPNDEKLIIRDMVNKSGRRVVLRAKKFLINRVFPPTTLR